MRIPGFNYGWEESAVDDTVMNDRNAMVPPKSLNQLHRLGIRCLFQVNAKHQRVTEELGTG